MKTNDIIIQPTSDLFIASLWSSPKNEPILRSLLGSVMTGSGQPSVRKATVLNPFNVQEFPVDKQIRLDIRTEDESGAIYDVEVQNEPHPAFNERILDYWSDTYSSQMHRGDDYRHLYPVRSIIITGFPIFPQLKLLHSVFEIRARENPAVLLSDHCQIHFLRLGNFLQDKSGLEMLPLDLQRWFQFWAYGSILPEDKMNAILGDSPVSAAYEEYRRFSADPVMRERERDRQRFLKDQQLNAAYAHAEGKNEGLAEGEAKGLAKGEAKRSAEVARNLKSMGLSLADISQATGLSVSEIKKL